MTCPGSTALAALQLTLDKWASRGPRSGLPLNTVAGVVGFVDGRVLHVGAAEEEGQGLPGALLRLE